MLVRPRSVTDRLRALASRLVEGDLGDAQAAARLVEGSEAVLHVAAVYRTAGHPDSYYREVNVGGTERLLEAAARAGVRRFVHTSTVGVHGHVTNPPADERAPIAPGDIYQATKAEAEALALRYHATRGVPVAVVRPGAIYGPAETRFLKLFRAIAHGRYAIVGDGRSFYHPVFIDDLVAGFLLALERPEAVGEAFLICGPRYVSQAELGALIAKHTNGRVLPFRIPAWPLQLRRGPRRGRLRPARDRPAAAPPARRLLDEEPRVHDREGAPLARLRAEGGPGRGHRAHRGVVPRARVALMAASRDAGRGQRQARLALGAVCAALVVACACHRPAASRRGRVLGRRCDVLRDGVEPGDAIGDVRYEAADLARIRARVPGRALRPLPQAGGRRRHDRRRSGLPLAAAGAAGRGPALLRESPRLPGAGRSARRRSRHARASRSRTACCSRWPSCSPSPRCGGAGSRRGRRSPSPCRCCCSP